MTTIPEEFALTPIGKLIALGLTNAEIANLTGVSESAASKWRHGTNAATAYCQNRAAGYLDGLNKAPQEPINEITVRDTLFMINVPYHSLDRFNKVMIMLGLIAINMDE